jgi:hypothetical protein
VRQGEPPEPGAECKQAVSPAGPQGFEGWPRPWAPETIHVAICWGRGGGPHRAFPHAGDECPGLQKAYSGYDDFSLLSRGRSAAPPSLHTTQRKPARMIAIVPASTQAPRSVCRTGTSRRSTSDPADELPATW